MHQLLEQLPITRTSMPPDLHQQAIGVHGAAGLRQQHLQQPQLELGERDRRVVGDAHRVVLDVQRHAAGGQRRLGTFRCGPSQQRLDARQQRLGAEGLGQVVIGAQVQRFHEVLLFAARRQHHHGHITARADGRADFEARGAGHVDVEDHEIRRLGVERSQRTRPIAGLDDEISRLRQRIGHETQQVEIVVGDQDFQAPSTGSVMVNRVRFSAVRDAVSVPP